MHRLYIVRFGPDAIDCSVDVPRALKYMGQKGGALPADLEPRLDSCIQRCEERSHPLGIARSFPIHADDETGCIVVEDSSLVLPGASIARHLEGCAAVALLAVTLGMDNERALLQAQATSPLDALLLDACSSSLAEEATACLARRVDALAAQEGLASTKRFSPGFGDLPLEIQPTFLAALQADRLLGIHASSSHLMTPMKSVTALIGLAPAERQ